MSTTTTNFNLHKPELADPADITQLNQNWETIDRELYKVYNSLSELNLDNSASASELTESTVTMGQIIGKMRDNSMLCLHITANYTNLDAPTQYGNLVVMRYHDSRVHATLTEMNSNRMWYGSVDSTTLDFGGWTKLYSETSKPTPVEIGAIPLDGSAAMTGTKLKTYQGYGSVETYASAVNMRTRKVANDDSNSRRISLSPTLDLNKSLQYIDTVNGKETIYEIYGEHNKPTPAEIGAMADSIVPIKKGGTNATDVETARANLGFVSGSYDGTGSAQIITIKGAENRNVIFIWASGIDGSLGAKGYFTPQGGVMTCGTINDQAFNTETIGIRSYSRGTQNNCYFENGKLYINSMSSDIAMNYINKSDVKYYYQVV